MSSSIITEFQNNEIHVAQNDINFALSQALKITASPSPFCGSKLEQKYEAFTFI
jgi:hypothetical protein